MNRFQTGPELNNDEAFLNLLSSQRELLSQLNRENANRNRSQAAHDGFPVGSGTNTTEQLYTRTFVPPNHSICEPSMQENFVYSKRFSLGLGNDLLGVPPPSMVGEDASKLGIDSFFASDLLPPTSNLNGKKRDFFMEDFQASKKRRLSGAGFLQSFLYLDELPFQPDGQLRRPSFSSMADSMHFPEDDDMLQGFDSLEVPNAQPLQQMSQAPAPQASLSQSSLPPPKSSQQQTKQTKQKQLQLPNPAEARKTMLSLSNAMEKSQKSQQDIHDWDRKMGLKRSHSKTMRLSTRSRKKLRAMLKKQINALSSNKKR